ncbi:MAG: hypothetical protein KA113_01660 [Syntrophaceae bacterium]|nr:hypothetical protein [Syntrophaceae bacterium]
MKNEHKLFYLEERIQLLESEIEKLTKENRLLAEKQGIQNKIELIRTSID